MDSLAWAATHPACFYWARVPRDRGVRRSQPSRRTSTSNNNRYSLYTMSSKQSSLLDDVAADPVTITNLVEDAIAWCSQHGLVYGAGLSDLPVATVPAPVSLLPVAYPRATFEKAKRAATAFNTMIDAVSRDDDYLQTTLRSAARHDDFTARLLQLHSATAGVRAARRDTPRDFLLAINRSDYMLHSPTSALLQVELNTIAASFGCLSTLVCRMHRYLLERSGAPQSVLDRLPFNDAKAELADALGAAVTAHGAPGGVVVMVVQPGERNAFDQQWLQFSLWERHGVRTLRRTLAEVEQGGALGPEGSSGLFIDGHTVSVVYFRAGYSPNDYPTDAEWRARDLIERSDAIACPSVAMQLAGAKKVQQDLAVSGRLERFASTPEDAELMRALFAGLWSLDGMLDAGSDVEAEEAVKDALQRPEGYVLKPQREGGGNNLYGEVLREKLRGGGDLGDLILMQRILPPAHRAIMLRLGQATEAETLSELGVFGVYLRRGRDVLLNREAGHLVRTKTATSDEGGVAAGFAVLDSPYLIG